MKVLDERCTILRPWRIALAVLGALTHLSAASEPLNSVPNSRDADLSRWADNYIEAGAGAVSGRSFRFGEWTGLHRAGGFPILNFNWLSRELSQDSRYWSVSGVDLGLAARRFSAGFGNQGRYDFFFALQQIPHYDIDSARFIHQGLGTNALVLPPGFPGFAQPAAAPGNILPYLSGFDIGQSRDIYRIGLSAALTSAWDFKTTYREDRREGTRLVGAQIGSFRASILPYPVDDKVQQAEAILAYAGSASQLQLGYYYSNYVNEDPFFTWQQPYTGVANAPLGTLGRMSLAPSNEFHQVSATAGYNVTKATRLSGTLNLGRATQNDPFLPYTSNSLVPGVTGLPRDSLEGRIDQTHVALALTTRPLEKMNLKLGYQHRDNRNKSPQAQYRFVRLDAMAPTSQELRTNAPPSTRENAAHIDADYEIARRTYIRGLYERKETRHTNVARERVNDDRLGIELRGPLADGLSGAVGYTHNRRTGSRYDQNAFFEASYDPSFVLTRRFDNHPSMRQFIYADHTQNRLRASGSWTVSETVSLQLAGERFDRRYGGSDCGDASNPSVAAALGASVLPETCLGRTRLHGDTYTVDLQWQPEPEITAFGFYTYSRYGTDQRARSWSSFTDAANEARDFTVRSEYRDDVLGAGLKWQAHERLELGGQYAYSDGRGRHDVAAGAVLGATAPVPENTDRLHTFQLFAKWRYSKTLTWRLNYWYEQLSATDWAYDNATPVTVNNVLLTGQQTPRYRNHVLGVSVAVEN